MPRRMRPALYCPPQGTDPSVATWRIAAAHRGARVCVSGTCMQPHLRDGQIVRVGPLRGRAPEIGEIVYYVNTHDATALHRMLARAPTRYGWRFLIGSDDGSALDLVRETSLIGRLSLEDAPGKLQAPPYWREWRARHKALCFVAGVCLRLLNIGEVVPVKWAWDTYRAAQTAPGNHE